MRRFAAYKKEDFKEIDFNIKGIFLSYRKMDKYGEDYETRGFDFELFFLPNGIPLLLDHRDAGRVVILDLRTFHNTREACVYEIRSFAEELMYDILETEEELGVHCPDYEFVDMKAYSEVFYALQRKYGKEYSYFPKKNFQPRDFKDGEVHALLQKYFKGYIPASEAESYYMEHISDILEDTDKHTENFKNKVFPFTDEELIGFAKTFSYLPEYLNIERNE